MPLTLPMHLGINGDYRGEIGGLHGSVPCETDEKNLGIDIENVSKNSEKGRIKEYEETVKNACCGRSKRP